MAKRLDDESRDILAYRPEITFVEPEVVPGLIEPIEVPVQLEEIESEKKKVRQLAKAVNALATAVQARADEKAKGMVIKLDPKVDAQAVMAMRGKFPDADPTKITFEQYKKCKEDMRKRGEEIGKKATITPEQVSAARAGQISTFNKLGGFGTPAARDGGLRPELDKNAQIIEPLDIGEFQNILLKILVNYLWFVFIKPTLIGTLGPIAFALPDKLVDIPEEVVGLLLGLGIFLPGEDLPKIQKPPELPQGAPEGSA